MSQNRPDNDTSTTGGAGTTGTGGGSSVGGGASTGISGDQSQWGSRSGSTGGGAATGAATGLSTTTGTPAERGEAGGLTGTAKQYGQKVAEYGQQAKEYVGDKISDLRNKDYGQIAEEAKDYARQNPGQALLVAAAAGFVLGLLLRGGRR